MSAQHQSPMTPNRSGILPGAGVIAWIGSLQIAYRVCPKPMSVDDRY